MLFIYGLKPPHLMVFLLTGNWQWTLMDSLLKSHIEPCERALEILKDDPIGNLNLGVSSSGFEISIREIKGTINGEISINILMWMRRYIHTSWAYGS